MTIRSLILNLLYLLSATVIVGQNPVKWAFSSKDAGNGQYDLIFTATIDDGWNTYSQFLESEDGPVATALTFEEGPHFKLLGKAKEGGEKFTKYDNVFGMNLTKFKHKAIFTQRVQVSDVSKPVKGYLTYMVCNDEMCLPPKDVDFKFELKPSGATPAPADAVTPKEDPGAKTNVAPLKNGGDSGAVLPSEKSDTSANQPNNPDATAHIAEPADPNFQGFFDSKREINSAKFVNSCSTVVKEDSSLWLVFLAGLIFGLAAVLTPCIFPMIPVTVGFFVKRSKDRATGLRNAFLYGTSIYLIYVAIGIGITAGFGATALNEMSTNMWFNLFFFLVFLLFALSFFGLFEITLPSSWVNASDKMADKGGLIGVFFMAFTLALVSFSCTGPLVGSLLVETAHSNNGQMILGFIPARPFAGLSGFGVALALPFALFAMFPSWLHNLPRSGGWMDNVKITLGFVELALAFKFLSTADMVMHWGVLRFEPFMSIWALLALLLGLYQLGVLGWKGAKGFPGALRLVLGTGSLVFAGSLLFSLVQYRSLTLLSGLAPPVHYNFFHPADCPHGLDCYHDFDEALKIAQLENKPLFVDFTGYGCVNCRKMEETVWNKPGVIEHLRDHYVVVSLYVDDKARLFPDNKFKYLLDPHTQDKMRTVGDKWSSFQINNFARNSQPWYVLMHNDGKTLLNEPRGYTPEVTEYKAFLDCGFDAFAQMKNREEDKSNKSMIGSR